MHKIVKVKHFANDEKLETWQLHLCHKQTAKEGQLSRQDQNTDKEQDHGQDDQ